MLLEEHKESIRKEIKDAAKSESAAMKDNEEIKGKIIKIKKRVSLRRRLLSLVVLIWMLPVLIMYLFMTISYRNNIIGKTNAIMEENLKNFTYFSAQKIDEAIDISKKTSYELVIEKAWRMYEAGNIKKSKLYSEITGNLKSRFYIDNRFVMSVFYLSDEPDKIYYTSRENVEYINIYKNNVAKAAHEITSQDTSDAHVRIIDGKIYIIRNLYTTTKYTKFGTLVLELNKDKLIDGISLNKDYEIGFFINDTSSMISYNNNFDETSRTEILDKLSNQYSQKVNRKILQEKDRPFIGLLYQQKYDDFHFGAVLVANENVIFSEIYNLYTIMLFIMLIIIPVFIYMIYFIAHHITKPMSRMIEAANKIEQGGIGMQIESNIMPNLEFDVLQDAFNHMSSEIKYLFDYAYNEKIARRDAKIKALQSQINPHFLNNTLEMMNWQARMAGDVTVSKMIEALGTLLNYSMDRSNRKMLSLAEELRCVEAYLYIVSMRFGKRLKVEKEVDENLLQIKVPQLILQPLIENAVVHGVETVKSGTIQIKIYQDKENNHVILQIINTGKDMSEEDISKVDYLLNGKRNQNQDEKTDHESLGIQNVNERIKLIYGEEYGLSISPIGEGETASTITIPFVEE
ncbi:sensor histidine kinase [Anaerocolumna aminovalerica]|uniref:Two-component system, sensor histidine kinase YesM n=2 Tax=Anaerocolumna aminovalerica TaxID=1527 RepID=A0A1I5D9P3_9FIRM|nr:histidine kinase [Anaerocolumna aminovalerica]MBU5332413.1 histidine kinase [Anaerocolumna aminovalerica]SFN95837.1 two-component system, sensor histidine kinase YesM [Anaerocolumna aminovalerica]